MKLLPKRAGRRVSTWARQRLAYSLRGRPRPRFVFVHIPKTAGVTVTKYFRTCFGVLATGGSASLSDPPWHTAYVPENLPAANRADFVAGHMCWPQVERLDSMRPNFVFTFMRDPLARLWSVYDFVTDYPDRYLHKGIVEFANRVRGMSPEAFFMSEDPETVARTDNYMVRQMSISLRDYPVAEGDWPKLTEIAKANLAKMSFVGFQESFDADFSRLLRLCHLPPPPKVPHQNKSNKRARPEVAPAVAEIMHRRTRWDQDLFAFARTLRERSPHNGESR